MPALDDLNLLTPLRRERVYDLLQQVGMDVSDWSNYKKGATAPAANPKYCYEWSFTEGDRFIVLNLWHASLQPDGDDLVCQLNMRSDASEIERAQDEKWRDKRPKPIWAKRARAMDLALQRAARASAPIRVIVCEGTMRDHSAGDEKSSEVKRRLLDPVPWRLESYEWTTGAARLRRGVQVGHLIPEESTRAATGSLPVDGAGGAVDKKRQPNAEAIEYVDQFEIRTDGPRTQELAGTVYIRDAVVRRAALVRAGGRCQLCGESGFRTASGKLYLETHHIVPLSEGGADTLANVVALCATDHRRAHFDADQGSLGPRLLAIAAGERAR